MKDYKPCRRTEIFKIENNKATIIGFKSLIELNEVATILWKFSDGKHTMENIVDKIANMYSIEDKELIGNDIKDLISSLEDQGLIILNWDSIYKHKIYDTKAV